MNFKFTKVKVIWSVIIALLVILISTYISYTFLAVPNKNFFEMLIGGVIYFLVFWIPVLILTYTIWSLFQKK